MTKRYFRNLIGGHAGVVGASWFSGHSSKQLSGPYCSDSKDCRADLGKVCWHFYEGCSQGQCVCDPNTARENSHGHCELGTRAPNKR